MLLFMTSDTGEIYTISLPEAVTLGKAYYGGEASVRLQVT